ncbi:MAG: helix-turn-helix transcriptional regulator [Chloroflexaceae bacterium]|nr:helix-turn-helix transcriptional regulator [Chloroflexaceae bacterium]
MIQRFSEKLRTLRERHGWSQRQLADQLGFTRAFVVHLESGRKKPHAELLLKIANLFGVTVDQLVRDEQDV